MRICSLLPSATEIAYLLDLGDELVGVTHECDFPPAARSLPKLTANLLPPGLSSAGIDRAVAGSKSDAHTIYALDSEKLVALAPDLVLTQNLCEVCAVPRAAVDEAVCAMPRSAEVMALDPGTLDGVLADIERVGQATGREARAREAVAILHGRIETVRAATSGARRPRVFCAEWPDPIYCAGHWLPGMVEIAGGRDDLGRAGEPSTRVEWEAVLDYRPEVLVLMPCGYDAEAALALVGEMTRREGWASLPAVREGRVFVVDASAYYARPGPRLVDGLELLARMLHPDRWPQAAPDGAAYRLTDAPASRFEAYR